MKKKSSTTKKKFEKKPKQIKPECLRKKNCVDHGAYCACFDSAKKIVFDHDAYCVFIYDWIIEKIEKKLVICATSKKKGNNIVDE